MDKDTITLLTGYAARYESAEFLKDDPSWFMHQVDEPLNQETVAFVASCLSFGSRPQFMPRIQWLLDSAGYDLYGWLLSGGFERDFHAGSSKCFYRFYNYGSMYLFFRRLSKLLRQYGSIGKYVHSASDGSGIDAARCICRWFAEEESGHLVPADTKSACKRICMFLRWMGRNGSPVDLGLWAHFIRRRELIMPLDTHVLQQSVRLGLLNSRTATMSTAIKLTDTLAEAFPDDPLKGDFALFGYGINHPIHP